MSSMDWMALSGIWVENCLALLVADRLAVDREAGLRVIAERMEEPLESATTPGLASVMASLSPVPGAEVGSFERVRDPRRCGRRGRFRAWRRRWLPP